MLDLSGTPLPFNVIELINTGMGLLKLFGPFILLSLAVSFTPEFIKLLRNAIQVDTTTKSRKRTVNNTRKYSSYRDGRPPRMLSNKYRRSVVDMDKNGRKRTVYI